MPNFEYTARRASGEFLSGTLMAGSRHEALSTLTGQSMYPIKVQESRQATRGRRVSGASLMAMYSMLADLLESGVPILRSLEILEQQTSHAGLRAVVSDIRDQVADGSSLATACGRHPRVFSSLAISILHAGEEGGFLEDSLTRLARFTERAEELRGKVLAALAYPLFLMVTGAVVLTGMMVFFVPKFTPMFERMRSQGALPLPTRMLLDTSDFLTVHAWWIGCLILGLIAALIAAARTPQFQLAWDRFWLTCPGAGSVVRSLAISRFCRVLGTLQNNGVTILRALGIARDATGNRVLSQAIAAAATNVSSGKTLAEPLRSSGYFPPEILELISVGEQANRLDDALLSIADKWETRTHRKLDTLMKLIEPTLMLLMALLVGFMVIALLLPVFENSGGMG